MLKRWDLWSIGVGNPSTSSSMPWWCGGASEVVGAIVVVVVVVVVRGHPHYPIPITKPDNYGSGAAPTSIPTHYIPPHRRVYSKNPIVT